MTTSHYFDVLLAGMQFELDNQNLRNIDTLLKTIESRFQIGTVILNDVLQAKVSLLSAKNSLTNSKLSLNSSRRTLSTYLNLNASEIIVPEIPDSVPFLQIDVDHALTEAAKNRKYIIEFKRRRLEAEHNLIKTRGESGPTINLNANLGLTQTGQKIPDVYERLLRNQSITVGFNIPILDWGVNKSNKMRAQADMDLEINNIKQQGLKYEQEIYDNIVKWNSQQELLQRSKEARNLAGQRYEIATIKYATGGLTYTDFSNAQLEKDRTVINYINNLKDYWLLFYEIRRLTLFDYVNMRELANE